MRRLLWLSVILGLRMGVVVIPLPAEAHPGRLDQFGCHYVRAPYTYRDGMQLATGDYHCHRPLGRLELDRHENRLLPDPERIHPEDRERMLTGEEQNRP